MSSLALSSPPPSTICLAHLHLELSFIILLLFLPFLIVVIAASALIDHVEEAGVTDIEVVACAEIIPPVLETHAHIIVHEGPIQAHELGLCPAIYSSMMPRCL